jgi:hypothetical protein
VLGLALSLAPITAASAAPRHHSGKGSNPDSAMCRDVKAEQSGSSSVGSQIEKALTSGNFAQAKQDVLNAYAADQGDVQKALAVVRTAPANVQAAFKNLLSYVKQIRNDIASASSLQGLITSLGSLGKSTQLENDGTTIDNWYTSVCGSTTVTTG